MVRLKELRIGWRVSIITHFNSNMVRLKDNPVYEYKRRVIYFNSKMVRLKVFYGFFI